METSHLGRRLDFSSTTAGPALPDRRSLCSRVCWSTDFCARRSVTRAASSGATVSRPGVLVQRFFTTRSGGGIGKSAHPNGACEFAGPGQPSQNMVDFRHVSSRPYVCEGQCASTPENERSAHSAIPQSAITALRSTAARGHSRWLLAIRFALLAMHGNCELCAGISKHHCNKDMTDQHECRAIGRLG